MGKEIKDLDANPTEIIVCEKWKGTKKVDGLSV